MFVLNLMTHEFSSYNFYKAAVADFHQLDIITHLEKRVTLIVKYETHANYFMQYAILLAVTI